MQSQTINFPLFVEEVSESTFGVSSMSEKTLARESNRIWNGLSGYIAQSKKMIAYEEIKKFRYYSELGLDDLKIIHSVLNKSATNSKTLMDVNWIIDYTKLKKPTPLLIGLIFLFHVSFDKLEFDQAISFYKSIFFSTVSFYSSKFRERVIFTRVIFKGVVNFDNVEFCAKTDFNGVKFKTHASFKGVKTTGRISFRESRFNGRVSFKLSEFKAPADFSKVEFSDAELCNTKFHDRLNFEKTVFSGDINLNSSEFLNQIRFDEAHFTVPPSLLETTLYESTSWHNVKWPSLPSRGFEAKTYVRRYERLCILTQNADRPEYFHQFYKLKMRAKRPNEHVFSSFVNIGYDCICEYGFNFERVFCLWVSQIIVGAIFIHFLVVRKARVFNNMLHNSFSSETNDFSLSLLYSLSNSLPFLSQSSVKHDFNYYNNLKKVGSEVVNAFRLIGYIQIVLGTILLFFLLLTLRNKFKLK